MSIGLVGIETGMTRVFDESGTSIPVTVINIDSNRVSQIKTIERDGYSAVQIGFGLSKDKLLNKPKKGHLAKSGDSLLKYLKEYRVLYIANTRGDVGVWKG